MYVEERVSGICEAGALRGTSQEHPELATNSFEECADLRKWFATATILSWIEQEMVALGKNEPRFHQLLDQNPNSRPEGMLSVLTFAYAGQMFDSDEIAAACHSDAAFQQLCKGETPFAYELQNFRHKHRALLERLLTRVLVRAIKAKFDLDASLVTAELEQDVRDRATQRLDIARHVDAGGSC